jgi:hypothetical protein
MDDSKKYFCLQLDVEMRASVSSFRNREIAANPLPKLAQSR